MNRLRTSEQTPKRELNPTVLLSDLYLESCRILLSQTIKQHRASLINQSIIPSISQHLKIINNLSRSTPFHPSIKSINQAFN